MFRPRRYSSYRLFPVVVLLVRVSSPWATRNSITGTLLGFPKFRSEYFSISSTLKMFTCLFNCSGLNGEYTALEKYTRPGNLMYLNNTVLFSRIGPTTGTYSYCFTYNLGTMYNIINIIIPYFVTLIFLQDTTGRLPSNLHLE